MADPVEEDHTVVCLQFPEGQAYRGLGHVQGLRRPGDVAVLLTDLQKNPDMPQGHSSPPPIHYNFIMNIIL